MASPKRLVLSHLPCSGGQPCRWLNSLGALLCGAGTASSARSFEALHHSTNAVEQSAALRGQNNAKTRVGMRPEQIVDVPGRLPPTQEVPVSLVPQLAHHEISIEGKILHFLIWRTFMARKALEQQARMEQEVVEWTEPQHFSVATPRASEQEVVPEVGEYVASAPTVFPSPALVVEYISRSPPVGFSPAPVVEYISPAPSVVLSPAPDVEYLSPAPAVFQAPSILDEYFAPAPAVFQAPTPVMESFAPVSAVSQSPAPVVESFAPAPPGLFSVPLVEKNCTCADSAPIASASGGFHFTVSVARASDGVFLTRVSCDSVATSSGGVFLTRASCDSVATASRGVHLTCAGCGFIASASRGEHLPCAGRDLASPHPFPGAIYCSLVRCLRVARDVQFWILLGLSVLCAFGLAADTVHVSVFCGLWLFHTFPCEGGPRILRSILGQTHGFSSSPSYSAVTGSVRIFVLSVCFVRQWLHALASVYGAVTCSSLYVAEECRNAGFFWEFTSGVVSAFSAYWLDEFLFALGSRTLFLRPSYLASTYSSSCWSTRYGIFWEIPETFPYSSHLVGQWIHVRVSSPGRVSFVVVWPMMLGIVVGMTRRTVDRWHSTGAVLELRCRARCATTGFWPRQCSTLVLTTSGTVGLRAEQIRLQEYVDRTWRTERLVSSQGRALPLCHLLGTCSPTACRLWLLAVLQLPVPIAIGQARLVSLLLSRCFDRFMRHVARTWCPCRLPGSSR